MIESNTQIMVDSGKQERTRRLTRGIVMFYVIVGFPLLLIYGILTWLTELKGKALLNSLVPVAAVLLVLFCLYLLRPLKLRRFLKSELEEH